ncbi:kinesin-related protein 4 [Ricinus communis]|uniref:kinesin-related protein 4 n=1 Tax=Ricinus communis TaxID=3988 RepID=UPI00201A253B|nr:kinesin-related protein 4 [Ricinus communis]
MGCFLGCFGFPSKRKRRKPANRVQPGDHRLGSYEPLDSASTNLDAKAEPISKDSESSKKPKEPLNYKIKKKVSFNLNVQSYEPIPKEDENINYFWENDDEEKRDEISKENAKEGQSKSLSEDDSVAAKMASYPSSYRYRNCTDSYDDEDEIAYEESDLDDDEDENDDDDSDEDYGSGGDMDNLTTSRDEFSETFKSLSLSSQMRDSLTRENSENLRPLGDLNSVGMNRNARDRSQYVHSVLNPIENLSQWKAAKAKGMPQVKRQRKENVALEQQAQLTQEISVDASLSNWILNTDSCQSTTASITKSSTESISSKKSSFDRTFPWRSRDDMPILDITNLEV